jgi:uncharacterized membrane protein YphA (DoxX/SURF4 family)
MSQRKNFDMNAIDTLNARMVELLSPILAAPVIRWIALLGLCAAYLQGGFDKAADLSSAIAQINHFGLSPAAPLAVATIVMEIVTSILVLTGFFRWLGALSLAGFTLFATFVANCFWEMAPSEHPWLSVRSSNILASLGAFCLSPGSTCVNKVLRPINRPRRDRGRKKYHWRSNA